MSLLQETKKSWWHYYACRVLQAGPIPKHVAFIMDGNRRYAKLNALGSPLQGHSMGFQALANTLESCRDLGIKEVTVYAFSLENFKRSGTEVNGLWDLAREKFREVLDNKQKIQEQGVCFRFLGDLSRLPEDLQSLIAEIELISRHYDKSTLNVCLAYTAQDEMVRAARTIISGVREDRLKPCDIDNDLIGKCLDTRLSPSVDLLIRTSGEKRLSDFLLWQCSTCCAYFDDVLWPDFNFYHLCRAIIQYQINHSKISKLEEEVQSCLKPSLSSIMNNSEDLEKREAEKSAERVNKFCDEYSKMKLDHLKSISLSSSS